MVNITSKGKAIHGSPFSCKVSGEGRKRSQVSSPATSEVSLGSRNVDLASMVAVMKTPSGGTEACLLKKMEDGSLGIAGFTPKVKGDYKVEVTQQDKPIQGSPFKVSVNDNNVCNASKVKLTGNLNDAKANQWNELHFDLSAAGHGALNISFEGPHRASMTMEKSQDPKHQTVKFRPHEPGMYLLNVRFGDEHLPGSPMMMTVGGEPSGRVRVTETKEIAAAGYTGPGSKCEFQLKIPGMDPLDMEAILTAPNGTSECCEIRDLPHHVYDIKFNPAEEGVHTVSLKHKGLHVSGSPFQYTVGQPPSGGPVKVECGGPGFERGEVGTKAEFNIYTREAGAGSLSVAIEGPSKAKMEVNDLGNGYTTVGYTVDKEGEYGIHIKFNDEHVPDSPAMVWISPDSADAKQCTVANIRDRGLEIGKPCTFSVHLNDGKGVLKAHAVTPSGTEDDVYIQELDCELNALRFIPKENGVYYIHVTLNEAHIPGSPFPMLVGVLGADPAMIGIRGDGLKGGESGKVSKFFVSTLNAGAGNLTVQIVGPSKCAIICMEQDEGYEFSYTPMAPGDYMITVKFCNVTVAGCPAKATITGTGKPSDLQETSSLTVETVEKKPGAVTKKRFTGDASKVVAKGNGLTKAFANRPATFTLDVGNAGQGLLMVGIITPNGNPLEELSYKKTRPTTMTCTYKTKEKGEHTLNIRWGADDIPGSPFTFTVA